MQDKGAAIGVRWAAGCLVNNLTNYVYPCHLMDVLDLPYAFIKNAYNGIMPSAYVQATTIKDGFLEISSMGLFAFTCLT